MNDERDDKNTGRSDPPDPDFDDLELPTLGGRPQWHPAVRVVVYLLTTVLGLQLFIGVPAAFIWVVLTGGDISGQQVAEADGATLLFVNAALAPATFLVTVLFVRRVDRDRLSSIGLCWPLRGRAFQALVACAGTAAVLGLWLFIVSFLARVDFGGLSDAYRAGPSFWPGPAGRVVAFFAILAGFVLQGGTEELIHRGYVYKNIKARWGWLNGAAASSVIFAMTHGLNPNVMPTSIVNTFLIGVVLATLVEWTGSLLMPVIVHAVWNFSLAHVLSVPVSGIDFFRMFDLRLEGPVTWTGGLYGTEGSLLLTMMLLPLAFFLVYHVDRLKSRVESPEVPTG